MPKKEVEIPEEKVEIVEREKERELITPDQVMVMVEALAKEIERIANKEGIKVTIEGRERLREAIKFKIKELEATTEEEIEEMKILVESALERWLEPELLLYPACCDF